MRLAALDVGSNTVHVLVADAVRGKLVDVAHYVEMPELGAQVARTGAIGARKEPALRAIRKVLAEAKQHGYERLITCATEAVRAASDRAEFVTAAEAVVGAPMPVISGSREAALSFLGAASRHASRKEWALVDLGGGGSTEVVIGRDREMLRSAKLGIGSGVLAAQLSDPPTPQERARLRRAALRAMAGAPDGEVERLVTTGGTASNLPSVLARRNPPAVLTTADLLACEARLDRHRAARIAEEVHLPAPRVKALRAGVEVLLLFLDWYGLAILHVSHEGLRHGMLLSYLERGEDWWTDG